MKEVGKKQFWASKYIFSLTLFNDFVTKFGLSGIFKRKVKTGVQRSLSLEANHS